jgi:hypothetical protein
VVAEVILTVVVAILQAVQVEVEPVARLMLEKQQELLIQVAVVEVREQAML